MPPWYVWVPTFFLEQGVKECEKILSDMRSLSKWIRRELRGVDLFLKIKNDVEYYQHETAQLMKRVERLEKKVLDLGGNGL